MAIFPVWLALTVLRKHYSILLSVLLGHLSPDELSLGKGTRVNSAVPDHVPDTQVQVLLVESQVVLCAESDSGLPLLASLLHYSARCALLRGECGVVFHQGNLSRGLVAADGADQVACMVLCEASAATYFTLWFHITASFF